ncbi:MAG: hypothetical protein GZ091_02250 [Paludibacter sp.]|nr:hypothetical protein [Paludibacter sp.]
MKKFIFTSVLISSLLIASSQNMNSLYFLDEWSQRHTLNAAFTPENGHFSFPLFGGINFNTSSNTGLSNYVYPYNSELVTFMHPSVDGHDFIEKLDPNIFLRQSMKINLLSFGFFTKNAYWSFDYNLKEQLNVNIPIDLFRLIKLGFEHETNVYDLKNLNINQTNITEFSLGYSRNINSKFRVGANLKLLVGLSTEEINYTQFDVSLANDRYEINSKGESIIMSNILSFGTDQNNNYDFTKSSINYSSKQPAGTGTAIDLGATYKPTNKLTLSAAMNDLGFIYWRGDAINKGIATSNILFTGFSVINTDDDVNIESQLNQLENDLNNLILFEKQPQSTTGILKFIPSTITLSGEYSLFGNKDHNLKFGLLWNSYNSANYHSNQLMGAITLKPLSWFSLSTTYSLFINESNRFGLALNFSPEWLNIFLATDFSTTQFNPQFLPIKKFDLSFRAGVSLYLGE